MPMEFRSNSSWNFIKNDRNRGHQWCGHWRCDSDRNTIRNRPGSGRTSRSGEVWPDSVSGQGLAELRVWPRSGWTPRPARVWPDSTSDRGLARLCVRPDLGRTLRPIEPWSDFAPCWTPIDCRSNCDKKWPDFDSLAPRANGAGESNSSRHRQYQRQEQMKVERRSRGIHVLREISCLYIYSGAHGCSRLGA